MRRILLFQPALAPYRVDLFNQLSERFQVTLCLLNANLASQKFDQQVLLRRVRARVCLLLDGVGFRGRLLRTGVFERVREESPDLVVVYEYGFVTLSLLAYRMLSGGKWRLIVMTDDNVAMLQNPRWMRKCARDFVLSRLDGVIVTTEAARDWMAQRLSPAEMVAVVPIIHDEQVVRRGIDSVTQIASRYREQYGLANKKVVLFVGRFHPVKNVPFLLKAFSLIADRLGVRLVLVGAGDEEEEYRKIVRVLDLSSAVVMPGRFEGEALYAWFALADVVVLPSFSETFGAVVNEALIWGTPCLVSEHVGAKSLLLEKKMGDVFPLSDARLLSQLLEQRLKEGCKDARAPSLMRLSLKECVEALSQSLSELLATSK